MAGETELAKQMIAEALGAADQHDQMTPDTLLYSLLSELLSELAQRRGRADLESYINFHLDNYDQSEWVITRGC